MGCSTLHLAHKMFAEPDDRLRWGQRVPDSAPAAIMGNAVKRMFLAAEFVYPGVKCHLMILGYLGGPVALRRIMEDTTACKVSASWNKFIVLAKDVPGFDLTMTLCGFSEKFIAVLDPEAPRTLFTHLAETGDHLSLSRDLRRRWGGQTPRSC